VVKTDINLILTVIDTVGKLIGVNWGALWNAILKVLSDIWDTIGTVVKTAINLILTVINTVGKLIGDAWGALWNAILKVLSGIWDTIGTVVKTAINLILTVINTVGKSIGDAWDAIWNGMKTGISVVWDAIVALIKAPINLIIGMINTLIGALDSLQIHTPHISIPNPLGGSIDMPSFDWNGFKLAKIPTLANGGMANGWTIVGERGPELAKLPGGTHVYSNSDSQRMAGQGGGVTIGAIYGVQPGDVERETTRAIRRAALTLSLEGR
jgi:hypothetical protein